MILYNKCLEFRSIISLVSRSGVLPGIIVERIILVHVRIELLLVLMASKLRRRLIMPIVLTTTVVVVWNWWRWLPLDRPPTVITAVTIMEGIVVGEALESQSIRIY